MLCTPDIWTCGICIPCGLVCLIAWIGVTLGVLHLHVGVGYHQRRDRGHIHVPMVHSLRVLASFKIHLFPFQATVVIFTRITTRMSELGRGCSSIVVVVFPQSCASCGI